MFYAPLCECGGEPVLNLVRETIVSSIEGQAMSAEKKFILTKHKLKEDEFLDLQENDLLAAYCVVCGNTIELQDILEST